MPIRRRMAFYISAHGYGHGARSCDILRAFARLHPDVPLTVISALPAPFLRNRLGPVEVEFRDAAFDVGMVQLDSVRVDAPATLDRMLALHRRRAELIEQERAFLRAREVGLVAADIPALPLGAARRAGIPGVAVGNFAWDWIYEEFVPRDERWAKIVAGLRQDYAGADLLLRLPFHEPMRVFRNREDLPLVAEPGQARRDELAALTGARSDKTWVLLSFTSLDWDEDALDRVERLVDYEFFTVKPLAWSRRNFHAVDREQVPFSDVMASVDIVVSKPGFGLLSECVVNRKPLIYVDRADFREYAVLEAAVKTFLRHVHLPAGSFYRGEISEALAGILSRPEPAQPVPAGGAEQAARRLGQMLV